jgi:hypothetical protein
MAMFAKGASLVLILSILEACGAGTKPSQTVDVTLTPSASTIHVNSSVAFQATGASVVKYTTLFWTVQGEDLACTTESTPPTPPVVSCPNGWIWEPMTVGQIPQSTATYYSPSTAGTYQIVVNVQLLSGQTSKVLATVTVVP